MFFRNLFLFRFNAQALGITAEGLEAALDGQRLRDVGAIELSTMGFVSPFGRGSDVLVHAVGDFALIALGAQERLLPSDVVTEELSTRIEAMAEKTGKKPGGRERKRIKEEIITGLLPRAFVRESRMLAYFDLARGWLVVNTASRKAAENVVMSVRSALGSFPCVPMSPEESPRVLLTDWLATAKPPEGLTFGEECELRDPVESGAIVRCKNQELETDEVREHLKSGKQVFRAAFTFKDRISLVLSEDLVVRALRFLEVVQDELGDAGRVSQIEELDAIFALQTLELRVLLEWLESTFKISASPGMKLDGGDAPREMREAKKNSETIVNEYDDKQVADLTATLKKHGMHPSISFRIGTDLSKVLNSIDPAELSPAQLQWLRTGRRGSSSETMFATLHGCNTSGCALTHPLDPNDLGRCRRLLEEVPEFQERFPLMADLSPAWHELVANWGELCQIMDEEAPHWRDGKGNAPSVYEHMGKLGAQATESRDVLFDNAAMIVRVERRADISLLQRKLAVGYNRAARVLEQLEQAGIVSARGANGERKVLETTA